MKVKFYTESAREDEAGEPSTVPVSVVCAGRKTEADASPMKTLQTVSNAIYAGRCVNNPGRSSLSGAASGAVCLIFVPNFFTRFSLVEWN